MSWLRALLWIAPTAVAMGAVAWAVTGGDPLRADAWQPLASPGPLSKAHAFLGAQCATCHEPYRGVQAESCVVCHAGNESLLARESTAFHASVGSCRECHAEHLGSARRPFLMDHGALAGIGVRDAERVGASGVAAKLKIWTLAAVDARSRRLNAPLLTPEESILNCAACHATKDRHRGLLGSDCRLCHATASWRVADYRHPSPASVDCAQCHAAPPSHYMMHFEMVSMTVAKQPHARVDKCYLCHQTTSWNDIRGVGWYKHH